MTDKPVSKKQAFIAGILLLIALPLHAQQINGRFSTAVYGWEKFDTVGVSKSILLGLQNFQLDVSQAGFSLSTSVYGSAQLSDPMGAGGEFRVRNMFARYQNDERTYDLRLGRVPVFAGVGVGAVDGGYLKVRGMEKKFAFAAYGGSNVPGSLVYDHTRDLGNNFLVGAQATGELSQGTRFGLSYVNRRVERESYEAVRPDSLFNPVMVTISPTSRATQTHRRGHFARLGGPVRRLRPLRLRPQPRKDAAGGARRAGPGPRRPDPPRQRHLPRTVSRV